MYVSGVVKTEFESPADLEGALEGYCAEQGITTVFVKVLTDKYESPTARVRICVKEAEWERIMDPSFWPEDVEVREWYANPKDRRNDNNKDGY